MERTNGMDQKTFVTEEKPSVSFSDRAQSWILDYSFTAKLVLSDDKTKALYAEIATELLRYEGVKPKTLWSGVSFSVGKERLALVTMADKTLRVRLPGALKDGGLRLRADFAKGERSKAELLQAIRSVAQSRGLKKKKNADLVITAEQFRTESLNSLLTKGLVKILQGDSSAVRTDVYGDTVDTQGLLIGRHGAYGDLFSLFSEGEGSARLSQKKILRSVDEIWVRAIEDCIPALDELIRNPNHFIAESEDILPIEKTKRVSGRSIAHLCRHTDYLSLKEDGEMTPTKMLNVFREDSLLTYENKFLNTLIHRLYRFVSQRYRVACEYGADEVLESFEFENAFTHGDGRGKVRISVEYAEPTRNAEVKNTLLHTGLWSRVERLNDIVTGYINSSFAKEMDRNFVRPPILRTNAILKNKYFRECLALWEFIESYDDAGYGIVVDETAMDLSEEYVKAAYAGAAVQYLIFKHHTQNGFEDGESERDTVIPQLTVTDSGRRLFTEELMTAPPEVAPIDDLDLILRVAMEADRLYEDWMQQNPEVEEEPPIEVEEEPMQETVEPPEEEEPQEFDRESFAALCREYVKYGKENFAAICQAFLRYDGMKMIYHRHCARFVSEGRSVAVLTFGDKSMRLYVALPYEAIPKKFQALRETGKRAVEFAPSYIKIKSLRQLALAVELAELLAHRDAADLPQTPYEEPLPDTAIVRVGTASKRNVMRSAEAVHTLAVREPGKLTVPEEPKPQPIASDSAKQIAAEISGLIRPSGNYERPTEYGIDDTSAFMLDEQNVAEKVTDEA